MRYFILMYFACACVFAGTVDVSATCDGVNYFGVNTISCGDELNVGAEAGATDSYVYAQVINATGHTASASATFQMGYIFTVFGGTGDGSAEPELSATGGTQGGMAEAAGGVTISSSTGGGCQAGFIGNPHGFDTCTPTSVPFVFGIPQTIAISANAFASAGPNYAASVSGGANYGGFFIYVNGQPFEGAYFTLVPGEAVPEPDMFPVLAVIACAGLILLTRRRARG